MTRAPTDPPAAILLCGLALTLSLASARAADLTPAEAKSIAEEGFIYGLPIVMNYAVMYEFAVDKKSRPVQGAVQRDQQRAPRLHLQGHGRRHAQQRHALFDALAGPARRADGDLGAGRGEERATTRCSSSTATPTTTATSAAAPPAPTPATTWSPAPTGRARRPPGIKKVFHSTHPVLRLRIFRTQLFNPADMPNVVKVQAGYKAQPLSAFLKQPAPPAAPKIDFLPATTRRIEGQLLRVSRLRPAVRPRVGRRTRRSARSSPASASARARPSTFKDLSLEHKAAVLLGMKEGDDEGRQVSGQRDEEHQRLERRLALRRPRVLQRRLADARRRRQGRHLRQRCRRSHVSVHPHDGRRRTARRQQAQLHAHLPGRAVAAGERLLVGDDVRRQDATADQEPDRPLPDQLADAAGHEEERRRLADALHPERLAGQGQGSQLAARAQRPHLPGDALLLAEENRRRSCRRAKVRGSRRPFRSSREGPPPSTKREAHRPAKKQVQHHEARIDSIPRGDAPPARRSPPRRRPGQKPQHPGHLGRRHRHPQHQRLQPRHDGLPDAQHRPHRQAKARSSPTPTPSKAAPPAARRSSSASTRSAPAC